MTPFEHTLFFLANFKKSFVLVPSEELQKLKVSVKHRRKFYTYDHDKTNLTTIERNQ